MASHALLSASSASRWLHCPPSVRATEHIEDKTSRFAAEGTLAHSLAELFVKERLDGRLIDDVPTRFEANEHYYDGMANDVRPYVDYIDDAFFAIGPNAEYRLEEKVSYAKYAPGGFGTADALLMCTGFLEIVDLKFGKGVPVSAFENPQLMLYALGAVERYDFLFDFKTVKMTIVQPRLDSISHFEIEKDALLSWGMEYVKPRAKLAYHGKGEYCPGKWCVFCKMKGVCSARRDVYLNKYKNATQSTMTLEEQGEFLEIADDILAWVKDFQEEALQNVLQGVDIPGWKAVAGRSTRKIGDEEGLKQALVDVVDEEELLTKPKLKSLTELEKLIGKKRFNEIASPFITRANGKAKLVPSSNKQPALGSVEDEFDFM